MATAYTVTEITHLIKETIEENPEMHSVGVRGEVSNFKRHALSGHCYFTLKDKGAQIKCVMFQSAARKVAKLPSDGETVLVMGRISVYEAAGQYQLYADSLFPMGDGILMQQLEQLKRKLAVEGLFDQERKKPLPANPAVVGIVTSPTGAAVRDIITVSKRRNPGIRLLLYPVQVQGEAAASSVARAIAFMNRHHLADVLIVGRGGGSAEDLWAFNEEIVVRAIAESEIPVISSVGHETDITLADFAADMRAATPSQAAEMAVPDMAACEDEIRKLERRAAQGLVNCLRLKKARLEMAMSSEIFRDPHLIFAAAEERLDLATDGLMRCMKEMVQDNDHRFALLASRLEAVSPLAVLARGYAVATDAKGGCITAIGQVAKGDTVTIRVKDGSITSVVDGTVPA